MSSEWASVNSVVVTVPGTAPEERILATWVVISVCVWRTDIDCYEDGSSTSAVKSVVLSPAIMLQLNDDDDVQLMCSNRRSFQRYTGLNHTVLTLLSIYRNYRHWPLNQLLIIKWVNL